MLEGLEQVPWNRLTHAYGTAEDVPAYIRALASGEASAREKARNSLFSTIFHQGSRYRASAPAVPFLFEVLEAPDTEDKDQIIVLLEYLAVGYPDNHLKRGFHPVKEFARANGLAKRTDLAKLRAAAPQKKDDWELSRQNLWKKDAYEAVLRRIDVLQRLTQDADKEVRMSAVRSLAWFPDAAADSVILIRGILQGEAPPEEAANAIHCLALLCRYLKDRSDIPWMLAQLEPDSPYLVRVTTAFSLSILMGRSLPSRAIDVLLETMQNPEKAVSAGEGISWHWLGILGEVADVIKSIRPKATEAVIEGLCRAAEQVQDAMAGVDVFYALLAVTFPPPKDLALERDKNGFKRLNPARLTPIQVRALQAIGRSPVWKKEPFFYGRLMDLGLEYGLDWHPEPFAKFVESAVRLQNSEAKSAPSELSGPNDL